MGLCKVHLVLQLEFLRRNRVGPAQNIKIESPKYNSYLLYLIHVRQLFMPNLG